MTVDLTERPYNPGYGWYESTTTIEARKVMVYVSGRGPDDIGTLSARVNEDVNWVVGHLAGIRSHARAELLETRNSDWVDESHPAVSGEAFEKRLRLGAIRFQPDGTVELTFTAGDLFWGHWVVVGLDADHQFKDTYLDG